MRYHKILLFFIIILTIFVASPVFAYDQTTAHPALTIEIVDLYNQKFGAQEAISEDLKTQIIQGSIDEDIPPRWINHFYDPVYI